MKKMLFTLLAILSLSCFAKGRIVNEITYVNDRTGDITILKASSNNWSMGARAKEKLQVLNERCSKLKGNLLPQFIANTQHSFSIGICKQK